MCLHSQCVCVLTFWARSLAGDTADIEKSAVEMAADMADEFLKKKAAERNETETCTDETTEPSLDDKQTKPIGAASSSSSTAPVHKLGTAPISQQGGFFKTDTPDCQETAPSPQQGAESDDAEPFKNDAPRTNIDFGAIIGSTAQQSKGPYRASKEEMLAVWELADPEDAEIVPRLDVRVQVDILVKKDPSLRSLSRTISNLNTMLLEKDEYEELVDEWLVESRAQIMRDSQDVPMC